MDRKTKAVELAEVGSYHIQVTGRHVEITDSMKDYALQKISKLERFLNRIMDVYVIMDIQKIEHRVEIQIRIGNTKISSKASTHDMYVSIDQAVAKLEAQILRYKSKLQDHHAKGHAVLNMAVNVLSAEERDVALDFDDEFSEGSEVIRFKPHRVVKKETRPLKTLTYEESIMKMELSGDAFMVFKNEEDQKLKVIYRRSDGNYGIIEPVS